MKQLFTLTLIMLFFGIIYSCSSNSAKAENTTVETKQQQIKQPTEKSEFLTYIINPKEQNLKLYWKTTNGNRYGSFKKLKASLAKAGETLVFAMNAGMFKKDYYPFGSVRQEVV